VSAAKDFIDFGLFYLYYQKIEITGYARSTFIKSTIKILLSAKFWIYVILFNKIIEYSIFLP